MNWNGHAGHGFEGSKALMVCLRSSCSYLQNVGADKKHAIKDDDNEQVYVVVRLESAGAGSRVEQRLS